MNGFGISFAFLFGVSIILLFIGATVGFGQYKIVIEQDLNYSTMYKDSQSNLAQLQGKYDVLQQRYDICAQEKRSPMPEWITNFLVWLFVYGIIFGGGFLLNKHMDKNKKRKK